MNSHLHSAVMAKSAMELLATHGNKVNLLACCGVDYPHTHPLLIKSGRNPIVYYTCTCTTTVGTYSLWAC